MKKLEDIEKKDIFKAPEGYFDTLPSIIQSRVSTEKASLWIPTIANGLKYALPVLALVVTLLWFLKPEKESSPEEILASVNSVDLADYIQSMEINNEDFLDLLDYAQINIDSLNLQESFVIEDEEIDLTDVLIEYDEEI